MVKHVSRLLVVLLCCATLAAPAWAQTKIVHWQHSSEARDIMMREFAQEFMAANPGIEVDVQTFPLAEYLNKVLVAIAGGSGPDTMQVRSNWVPWLISSGMVQPLPASIISAAQLEEAFIPGPLIPLKDDAGQYYGLPTDVQTVVLFYQQDLMEMAGLDSSSPPSTWDEALDYGRLLTKRDDHGVMQQMGLSTGGYEPVLLSLMLQSGATLWDDATKTPVLNTPEVATALQWAVDLVRVHGVEDPAFGSRWVAFGNEKLGMVYAHPAMMGVFRTSYPVERFGITEIPAPTPDGDQTSLLGSWALTITNQTSDAEAAARWLMFVQSPEAQRRWLERTGELPTRFEIISDPQYRQDPLYEPIMWSLVRALPQPWVSDSVNPRIRAAWLGMISQKAPSVAIEEMQRAAEIAEKDTREARDL